MTKEHANIADANLHQPKGFASADDGALIVANGAGGSAMTNDGSSVDVNLYDNEISRFEAKDYSESVNAIGNTGTTQDIDLTLGNAVTATLDNNCTFTFSNPPATGRQGSFTLILTQDGTGGRTATWPASVDWAGGSAPALSSAASAVDILGFLTTDGGTTWYGFVGGLNFS